jgi:hypothetical protein
VPPVTGPRRVAVEFTASEFQRLEKVVAATQSPLGDWCRAVLVAVANYENEQREKGKEQVAA